MRIAVVQHRLRDTPSEDVTALADASARAVAAGAEWVVLPSLPSPSTAPAAFLPGCEPPASIGEVLVLEGDACLDPQRLSAARLGQPRVLVLRPLSENDLQSESFLELAIALSDSVAGLVIIAECTGAEQGDPGHGGSAVVVLGEVVAEALSDDELLFAEITLPIAQPEPPEPLPAIPSLLGQRRAFHEGHRLEVSEYPADVS